MNTITLLKNTIQEYAWGSKTAIPALLGLKTPSGSPLAELWMGAHFKGPSMALYENQWISLADLIGTYPEDILGKDVAARFDNQIPYLLKILAAESPLSIQAHPSPDQARQGFEAENRLNIPLDAPFRNYKDASHKPECICALEPFWALCGFRPISDILRGFKKICPESLKRQCHGLSLRPDATGLKHFFYTLMTMEQAQKDRVIQEAVSCASAAAGDDPAYQWIKNLYAAYPSDIGILSPALLNLVCLNPGEALFLPAGCLHAYLKGVGIELMANSDNVLRGGLTPKHIDVSELLDVLRFDESGIDILYPVSVRTAERTYPVRAEEFVLSIITVSAGTEYVSPRHRSIEIMICTSGCSMLSDSSGKCIRMEKGCSAMIPAAVEYYQLKGNAVIYKAGVMI